VGAQRALGRGPHSDEAVDAALLELVDRITGRLRKANRVARTVVLRLRFEDFSRATRSRTLVEATAETAPILATAQELLEQIRPAQLTLIGVAAANLADDSAVQLALPFERRSRSDLDTAVDEVRSRFGTGSLTRATLLGRTPGITAPLLPD
jgi:DNA polymerase-4